MAVRGDEVAEKLEQHLRETLDKMVGDIRSSIQDVRKAVDQQLDAAMQSVVADVKSISLKGQLQKALADFQPPAPPPPPAVASKASFDGSLLKRAVQSIEKGKSQVDVLNALLEQALSFASRSALLILKGDSFSGWKGVGFSAFGGNDEQVKRFTAAPGTIAELDRVLQREQVVTWNGLSLASRLGIGTPERGLLVPMVIKDKVSAALYVDVMPGDHKHLDESSVEMLVFMTGLLIDTLAIRKKSPSPSLTGGAQTPGAVATPPPATPRPAAPRPATTPAPPPRPTAPAPAARPAAPAVKSSGFGDFAAPAPQARTATPVAGAETRLRPPVESPLGGDRPSTQYVPPAGVARGGAQAGGQSEEAKKHEEARRFARLLVSEIKLYNESKVEQGRKNRDLYERMKEDIDRSRQMYDERIAEDVRKVSNYFYDELVRILADNNADALGL